MFKDTLLIRFTYTTENGTEISCQKLLDRKELDGLGPAARAVIRIVTVDLFDAIQNSRKSLKAHE